MKARSLIFGLGFILFGYRGVQAQDLLSILGGQSSLQSQAIGAKWVGEVRGVLDKTSAEQNIFLDFLEKGELTKSLYQWRAAFSNHTFASSDHGQALYAYLLWQNGLPLLAMEQLFVVKMPSLLPPYIQKLWVELAPAEHEVWKLARIQWKEDWTSLFGTAIEVRVRSHRIYDIDDIKVVEELLRKTTPDSEERALVAWQMVVALALNDETAKSAKLLNYLMLAKQVPVDTALLNLTAARLLFQSGYLEAAIDYYRRVQKDSEYWFVAQEEIAWSFMRKGEAQNTLATLQGLTSSDFSVQMGPEGLMLQSLSHLKICDYNKVSQDLTLFRNRFQKKARSLLSIKDGESTVLVDRLIDRMEKGRIELISLGADAGLLPRFVSRDEELQRRISAQIGFARETRRAEELYAQSLSRSSAEIGFQKALGDLKVAARQRWQGARSAAVERIKFLAQEELNEIKTSLQKMLIIEAELIQQVQSATRVQMATRQSDKLQKGSTGAQGDESLRFPFTGELWFDEIGNYRVDISKGCQARLEK